MRDRFQGRKQFEAVVSEAEKLRGSIQQVTADLERLAKHKKGLPRKGDIANEISVDGKKFASAEDRGTIFYTFRNHKHPRQAAKDWRNSGV